MTTAPLGSWAIDLYDCIARSDIDKLRDIWSGISIELRYAGRPPRVIKETVLREQRHLGRTTPRDYTQAYLEALRGVAVYCGRTAYEDACSRIMEYL